MKKKIYKVLGIVLTMAIVLTTCLCAMTATHAETAVTLVQGTIDGGVIKDGAANRAYTKDLISLYENVSVKIASGYKAAYHLYDYQGNWIKYIGSWQEGTMKTMSLSNYDTKAFYFRIVIGASSSNASGDNANFKVADLPADVITFEANPQDTVNGFVITPALVSGTVSGRANTNLNSSVQTHATRMYPINIYEVAEIESLTVADGHRVYVHYYGADGVWVAGDGWKTGTYKIACEGATYFRVTYDTASGSGNLAVDGLTLKMYAKDVTEDGATTPVTIQGNIISAQGGKIQTTSTNRIYTKNEYAVADYEKVTIADGYRMVVHFWGADGAYLGETGWQTGTKTLKSLPNGANATYFRVVAGDSANSDPFKPDDFPFGTLKLVLAPKDVLKDFVISPALVSGTINGAPYNVNTCFGTHATRLATYNTYKVADVYKIDVAEGCRIFVQFFKEDGTYNAGSGWQGKGTYTASKLTGASGATYFRITFDSADGSTTPPADGLKFYAISEQKVDGNVLYPAMAKGTVNGAANLTIDTCVADNAIRLHTYNVLKVADIESITVPANCRAFIHFFNEDGSYNGPQGWITTGTQKLSNMGPVKNGATQFKVTFDSADGGSTPSVEGFYFTLHEYDNACDGTCNNCDVTRVPADHVYENYTSNNDATCTQNATETGTCACGATDTREVADSKLDHVYENYTSNGDATCTADGTKTGTCACGATDTIADEGSMLDHTYENYTYNEDATCTANGTETGTCACGATDTREAAETKLGHKFVNYVSDGNATCTADGTKTAKCERCEETDTIADEGSMLDHTYENYTYNEDATCTANGTETGTCACGATDTREAAETKLGHKFVNYVSDGNATCTADGTKTAKCERCEETDTIADDGSMLDHTYENYTYNEDATCTANGTETGTCACGATDTREAAGTMLAHTFENYTSNDDATCEEDGTKTGTCVCGATDVIVDEGTAFGHTWKRPTCTDPKTCATCGATVGEAFGHDYDTNYDKDCNVCGDVREVEAITDIEIRDGKVYVNGKTSIKGLFCVDGEYYFADWGGVIKTGGKFYVKTSYCDLEGGKEYLFGEDGKMVHEEIIDGILYIHGRTATKGIYKIDGEYYFSNWGGKIEGGLKTTGYVENCDLPAGTYRFDENGKMLDNALYIDENGVKYIYVKGKTCVPGLYEIDGTLYAATWGGVVRTDGRFFVKNSFCDEEANGYFYCDADGVAEAI